MNLELKLKKLKIDIFNNINSSKNLKELDKVRILYFGNCGIMKKILKIIKNNEKKIENFKLFNNIKKKFNILFNEKKKKIKIIENYNKMLNEKIDVTLPGYKINIGSRHILNQIIEDIEDLCKSFGFEIIDGFEIESDYYNFKRMNIPKNHPARQMHDTFYITNEILLRTHTSPIQARILEKIKFLNKDKLCFLSSGKVFRRDNDDFTHIQQFYQIEGFVVGENISIIDLKYILNFIIKKIFGVKSVIRYRSSYFPFTEPSLEIDIKCKFCFGKGCNVCKKTGWLEVLGAGMIHPKILEMSNINSEKYNGFAFGIGVDRLAMIKYGINDIRKFYENDLRFLEQFKVR